MGILMFTGLISKQTPGPGMITGRMRTIHPSKIICRVLKGGDIQVEGVTGEP